MSKILEKPSHEASIEEKINWLRRLNQEHSDFFCSPDERLQRDLYRAQHPTEIGAFKCMDGRINIPILTQMPLGIIQPFRNLGGKFDLGWPYLGQAFENWVNYAIKKGRKCLVLVTYHFSKGDTHRGCAGFHYDTEAAIASAKSFKQQIERIFGKKRTIVYPIVVGLETDTDALIFHGVDDQQLDLGQLKADVEVNDLRHKLSELYPDMDEQMINDLLPLVVGNLRQIAEIKKLNRPVDDSKHREFIVGIGRGFDWLHEPNIALLIGPYSPDSYQPIKTAFEIIQSNMDEKRIKDDGFIVLASSPYFQNLGVDRQRAIEKTRYLISLAQEVATKRFPDLAKKMHTISAIIDINTRKIEEI